MGSRKFYYGDTVRFVSPTAYVKHQSHQGTVVGTRIIKKDHRSYSVRYQVRCECGEDVIPRAPVLDLIASSPGGANNVDGKVAEARILHLIGMLGHDEEITPEILDEMMSKLEDRQREILVMRYGLDGQSGKSLQAVANMYGLTRERIRQLEVKAIYHLLES